MFSYTQIQEFIKQAELNGACHTNIGMIKECETLKELLEHPRIAYWAFWYAVNVVKGPCKELEYLIKTNAFYACYYANTVLKTRWPEAESLMMKNPYIACLYALHTIKGRWLEAEDVIKTCPDSAFLYAEDVVKGRWEPGEAAIKKEKGLWRLYSKFVPAFADG